MFRAMCNLGWTWVEVTAPTEQALNEKVDRVFAVMIGPLEPTAESPKESPDARP